MIIAGSRCEVPLAMNKSFPGSRLSSVYLCRGASLTPARPPPMNNHLTLPDKTDQPCPSSQITGITQSEKFPQALENQLGEQNNFVNFSLEIHTASNDDKLPDPKREQVLMAAYSAYQKGISYIHGCVVQENVLNSSNTIKLSSDEELFEKLQELITVKYNADILIGYEIEMNSWGYLEKRLLELKGKSLQNTLSKSRRFQRQANGRIAILLAFKYLLA